MNDNIIKIILPFAPRTKKNNSRVVKIGNYTKILPSKNYVDLEKKCLKFLAINWHKSIITHPIGLECHFYKDKDYKADLVGYLQAIQDILVKAEVIADDNHKIVENTDGSRVSVDRENPRIEIYIKELSDVLCEWDKSKPMDRNRFKLS